MITNSIKFNNNNISDNRYILNNNTEVNKVVI